MTPFGHVLWFCQDRLRRVQLQVLCNQNPAYSAGIPLLHFGIFAFHGLSMVAIPPFLIQQSDRMSRSTFASASSTENRQAAAFDTRIAVATCRDGDARESRTALRASSPSDTREIRCDDLAPIDVVGSADTHQYRLAWARTGPEIRVEPAPGLQQRPERMARCPEPNDHFPFRDVNRYGTVPWRLRRLND